MFFLDKKKNDTILLYDGNDFAERMPLKGQVSVDKATLFINPTINIKAKAYLIKGDSVELLDMSNDGNYYKVEYKTATDKDLVYWISSEDILIQ